MGTAGCLKVTTEHRGLVRVLSVSGDLGTSSSVCFTEAVERAAADRPPRPARVVVDLSGVRSIDAVGARALAAATSPAAGRCRVVLRSLRPALRQIVTAVSPDLDLAGSGLVMAQNEAAAAIDPGSPTGTLVRESRKARSLAEQAISDTRRTAEMIAATEEKIAATLLRLAPQRPDAHDHLAALSRRARMHAEHLRDLAGNAAPEASLSAAAAQYDTAAGTLQRAIEFINTHARDDISVADIAAAACVTTRAVQLAFRRYLDTTPLSYLRQVRLEQAHRELLAARPAPGTVTRIAADWQFTNPSRFTARYRATYGVLPSHTLHSSNTVDAFA